MYGKYYLSHYWSTLPTPQLEPDNRTKQVYFWTNIGNGKMKKGSKKPLNMNQKGQIVPLGYHHRSDILIV